MRPLLRFATFAVALSAGTLAHADTYISTNCAGCHGQTGMGGMGPPIASKKFDIEEFRQIIRQGKGMMPGTPESELSDEDLLQVHQELAAMPWNEDEIPLAYKVGQFLSTQNTGRIFLVVFGVATLLAIRVLYINLKWAGFGALWPYIVRFGLMKSAWIGLKSLIVDGLLVGSLWKSNKHRWLMHGLMLYGMIGLVIGDILMQVFNPTRADLPMLHPIKSLLVLSGIAVFAGVAYVMWRYKTDRYIDNGLTLGRDFLFLNLLFHTVLSGFLSMLVNRLGITDYVMPIYIYHLAAVALLVLTSPFTRFSHAFLVPALIATTRIADAIAQSGVDVNFLREPCPGKHHKTERMARDVLSKIGVSNVSDVRIRYYP